MSVEDLEVPCLRVPMVSNFFLSFSKRFSTLKTPRHIGRTMWAVSRPPRPPATSPPSPTERAFERVGYRCAHRGPDGRRLIARTHFEIDHIEHQRANEQLVLSLRLASNDRGFVTVTETTSHKSPRRELASLPGRTPGRGPKGRGPGSCETRAAGTA